MCVCVLECMSTLRLCLVPAIQCGDSERAVCESSSATSVECPFYCRERSVPSPCTRQVAARKRLGVGATPSAMQRRWHRYRLLSGLAKQQPPLRRDTIGGTATQTGAASGSCTLQTRMPLPRAKRELLSCLLEAAWRARHQLSTPWRCLASPHQERLHVAA